MKTMNMFKVLAIFLVLFIFSLSAAAETCYEMDYQCVDPRIEYYDECVDWVPVTETCQTTPGGCPEPSCWEAGCSDPICNTQCHDECTTQCPEPSCWDAGSTEICNDECSEVCDDLCFELGGSSDQCCWDSCNEVCNTYSWEAGCTYPEPWECWESCNEVCETNCIDNCWDAGCIYPEPWECWPEVTTCTESGGYCNKYEIKSDEWCAGYDWVIVSQQECPFGCDGASCIPDPCAGVNCNDGNSCTTDSCSNGVCSNVQKACSAGLECSGGSCIPICTNECDPSIEDSTCSGNTIQYCGNYDSDSCYEWGGEETCETGWTCSGDTAILKSGCDTAEEVFGTIAYCSTGLSTDCNVLDTDWKSAGACTEEKADYSCKGSGACYEKNKQTRNKIDGTSCTIKGNPGECSGGECKPKCEAGWKCEGDVKKYQYSDCSWWSEETKCEYGCSEATNSCNTCRSSNNPDGCSTDTYCSQNSCLSCEGEFEFDQGYANCDQTGGCETDIAGDANNCGQCGNVCQKGKSCDGDNLIDNKGTCSFFQCEKTTTSCNDRDEWKQKHSNPCMMELFDYTCSSSINDCSLKSGPKSEVPKDNGVACEFNGDEGTCQNGDCLVCANGQKKQEGECVTNACYDGKFEYTCENNKWKKGQCKAASLSQSNFACKDPAKDKCDGKGKCISLCDGGAPNEYCDIGYSSICENPDTCAADCGGYDSCVAECQDQGKYPYYIGSGGACICTEENPCGLKKVCKYNLDITPTNVQASGTEETWQITATDSSSKDCDSSISYNVERFSSATNCAIGTNAPGTISIPKKGSTTFYVTLVRDTNYKQSCDLGFLITDPKGNTVVS
jgi:hypothetical protein